MADRPVFTELAKIQKDIGLPPSLKMGDYGQCRSYVQNSTERCNKIACSITKRNELDVLLFEFRHMTECGHTDRFYDKIESYITLTHCSSHRQKANKAFMKWKTQYMATAPNLFPDPAKGAASSVRPSARPSATSSATSSSDSLGNWSEASIMTSPTPTSPMSDASGDKSTSDLSIEKEMKNLAIEDNASNDARRMSDDLLELEKLRDWLEPLGAVTFPNAGKEKNNLKIFKTMKDPLPPSSMAQEGVLYIYKHNSLSGICKIGFSTQSAVKRQNQSGNCYGVDTTVIYESKRFVGARQAEKIVHTALAFENFHVHDCRLCPGNRRRTHKEWFLISEDQALTKVKGAESWLRLPAYTLTAAKYELTPPGRAIYNRMTRFSMSEWRRHTQSDDTSDNVSDVRSAEKLATGVEQIYMPRSSSPVTDNGLCIAYDGNFTTTISKTLEPQTASEAMAVGEFLDQALEVADKYQLQSKDQDHKETNSQAKESWVLARRQPNEPDLEVNSGEKFNNDAGSKALVLRQPNEANLDAHEDEECSQAEESESWALVLRQPREEDSEIETHEEHSQAEETWALALRRPNETNLEVNGAIVNLFRFLLIAEPRELRAVPVFYNP
ncbi:hypothetical protein ACHAPE_007335 [Trichoderma viride]